MASQATAPREPAGCQAAAAQAGAWPRAARGGRLRRGRHNDPMASHIALLRGINVGGRNKVPMAELREVVSALGHAGVTHLHPER